MDMSWVKVWRRKRILGMLNHVRTELIEQLKENPEEAAELIKRVKRDPEAMRLLKENGVSLP